jgi:hypothetical protein
MKFKLALIAGVAALAIPALAPAASAQTTVYGNIGYTQFDGDAVDVGGVTGRIGATFGRYIGVEGEGTVGTNDDNGVELDSALGIYAVGHLPITDRFDLFARAGASRVETSPGGDDDAFSYGVGANYFFTDKDGIRGDWTKHDFDNGGDVDTYSVSYVRRF